MPRGVLPRSSVPHPSISHPPVPSLTSDSPGRGAWTRPCSRPSMPRGVCRDRPSDGAIRHRAAGRGQLMTSRLQATLYKLVLVLTGRGAEPGP